MNNKLKIKMEVSAPFLAAYWPYIFTIVIGIFFAEFVRSIKHYKKKQTDTVDVNPLADSDFIDALYSTHRRSEDYNNKVIIEEEDIHIPYPYHDERYSEEEMINRSLSFYRSMNKRRTVRHISSEAIPLEVIQNIIHTAGTAPSGAHTEPWTFVVVQDKTLKAKIRELVQEEERLNYSKRMGEKWVRDLEQFKTNWIKPYLENAPYLILVFKQIYSVDEAGEKKTHYYNEMSVCIATGIMLAAIQNAGLVTVTSTPMNAGPRLRDLLGRPVNEKLILLLPVGYPAKDAMIPDLKRKPLDDILVLK